MNIMSMGMQQAYFSKKKYNWGQVYNLGDEYAFKVPIPAGKQPVDIIEIMTKHIPDQVGKRVKIKQKVYSR